MAKHTTPKRKITDWNKKSGNDSARISKRLSRRNELKDSASTTNDTSTKKTYPPRATGAPLLRLKRKIREIYDEDDENEDDDSLVYFNISLINDTPHQKKEDEKKNKKQTEQIQRIAKEQQTAGKLNLIMNTAMSAQKAGLNPKITTKDVNLANSPELNLKKIRKKTLKDKIKTPLKLKGDLPETNLDEALLGIKNAKNEFSLDSLEGFPAKDLPALAKTEDEAEMADIILKKSGRKKQKKNLAEIAKGLNKFKNFDLEPSNNKEKD